MMIFFFWKPEAVSTIHWDDQIGDWGRFDLLETREEADQVAAHVAPELSLWFFAGTEEESRDYGAYGREHSAKTAEEEPYLHRENKEEEKHT